MASETKHAPFNHRLKTEMERINLSCKEVCSVGRNEPTATAFTDLRSTDSLKWGDEKQIMVASARHVISFFQQLHPLSAICSKQGGLVATPLSDCR
jgi:hypothetical protein